MSPFIKIEFTTEELFIRYTNITTKLKWETIYKIN